MDKEAGINPLSQDRFYSYDGVSLPNRMQYDVQAEARRYQDAQRDEQREDLSFFETFNKAVEREWILPNVAKKIDRNTETDQWEDFTIDPKMQAIIDRDYNKRETKILEGAVSRKDLESRLRVIQEERETARILSEQGWSGVGASVLAGMTDPVAWAGSLAAGGAAGAIARVAKIGSIGWKSHLAVRALAAGVENAAIEAIIQDSQSSVYDIAWAFTLGAGMGGVTGIPGAKRKRRIQAESDIQAAGRADAQASTESFINGKLSEGSGGSGRAETELSRSFPDHDIRSAQRAVFEYENSLSARAMTPEQVKTARAELKTLKSQEYQKSQKAQEGVIQSDTASTKGSVPDGNKGLNMTLRTAQNRLDDLMSKAKASPKKVRARMQFDIAEAKAQVQDLKAQVQSQVQSQNTPVQGRKGVIQRDSGTTDTIAPAQREQRIKEIQESLKQVGKSKAELARWRTMTDTQKVMHVTEGKGPKNTSDALQGYLGSISTGKVYSFDRDQVQTLSKWAAQGASLRSNQIPTKVLGTDSASSVSTRLLNSDSLAVRGIANRLLEDPQGASQASTSAAMSHKIFGDRMRSAQARKVREGFEEYSKSLPKLPKNKLTARANRRGEFNIMVMQETQAPGTHSDPGIKMAAEGVRDQLKLGAKFMIDNNVEGTERIRPDKPYIPVMLDSERIRTAILETDEPTVREMLAKAYGKERAAHIQDGVRVEADNLLTLPQLADLKAIIQISKAKGRTLSLRETLNQTGFKIDSLQRLEDEIVKDLGLSPGSKYLAKSLLDDLDKMLKAEARDIDKMLTPRLRQFFEFDMNKGAEGLVNNDLDSILESYTREASANASFGSIGFRSKREFIDTLTTIEQAEINRGADPKKVKEEIGLLEAMQKVMYGEPIDDLTPDTRRYVSNLTKLTGARDLVMSGLAQIPEMGVIAAKRSPLMWWDSMSLKEFFRPQSVREGGRKLGRHRRADFAELDDNFGFTGEDYWLYDRRFQVDSLDELAKGTIGRVTDEVVESASRGTALFSGMKHIQGALDKVSLRSIAGTLKKVADGTAIRKISKADLVRAGWSDGFYEELIPWLRQNMTKEVGADGKARTIMNFAKMEPEMQARTIQGIQRLATADVQRMHLGELPLFMHKTTGKVLMQHRSFVYGSIEKQLVHGIKHNLIGFTGITLTCSAFATISHLTRTAARYYGTDEFDDKMQEAMDFTNPKTIFSVLQQTGTLSSSSMFLDALATFSILDTGEDTLGGMLGARSTSPRSVPSASMVSDLVRVPSTAVGILKGDKETVDMLKALHRVVPMARYFGVNQALNAIEADW